MHNFYHLPLDFYVIFDPVDQKADLIPLHVPALGVEIKVFVLHLGNLELGRRVRFMYGNCGFQHMAPTWEKYFSKASFTGCSYPL